MIAAGTKTLEIRAHDRRRGLAEGHLILFDTEHPAHPSILVNATTVRRYSGLAELLSHEDPTAIAGPGATRDEVRRLLTEIYPQPPSAYLAIEVALLNPVAPSPPPTAINAFGVAVIGE